MSDLISRQAAIDALERSKDKTAKGDIGGFYNTIIQNDINKIKAVPSAQPEIIRCKDCKHWKDSDGVYRRGSDADSKCPINLKEVYDGTFYCGKAEKKQIDDLTHVPDTNVGDTIFRQAAIEALSHMCSEDENGITVSRANVDSMLRYLPSAQPHWIPCSEQLPDRDGMYLVSGDEEVWICQFSNIGFIRGWLNPVSRPVVRAWCSMPEPYKGGENETL